MFCPKCGADCKGSRFCSECGQKMTAEHMILEPPIGRYEAVDGYIDVSYYTMTIHKENNAQSAECVIDYGDIMDVIFCEASDVTNGYLAIQEETVQLSPTEDEQDAVCDKKTLSFKMDKNQEFCKLYTFLKRCKAVTQTRIGENKGAKVCCPKCKSNKYFVHERPYHRPYIRGKSIALAIMMCIMYLCYRFSAKRIEYVCLECGNRWTK